MDKQGKRGITSTAGKSLSDVLKDFSDTKLVIMYEELKGIEFDGIEDVPKLRDFVNSYYGAEWNSGAMMLPTVTNAVQFEMARRWYKATKKSPIRRGRKKVE